MKKIILIGCPGGGKSSLARELHRLTDIPLFYLDMMYWNPDKTIVEREIFLERISDAIKGERWIIDGNYGSTLEMRLVACDTVIFLDYPTELCLDGVRSRRGKQREDLPWVETEEDAEFMEYIRGFTEKNRPVILDLLEKYKDGRRVIILKSREDAEVFLKQIEREL